MHTVSNVQLFSSLTLQGPPQQNVESNLAFRFKKMDILTFPDYFHAGERIKWNLAIFRNFPSNFGNNKHRY